MVEFQTLTSAGQSLTDRRSFDRDRDRRSFFRDHEVIADRHLVMRSQGDRDREI